MTDEGVPFYIRSKSARRDLVSEADIEVESDDLRYLSHLETPSRGSDKKSGLPRSPKLSLTDGSTIEGNLPYRASRVFLKSDASDTPQPAGDDTAIRVAPTRHVDYLSHEWREEDIWSSWRYIIAKRNDYPNSLKLENACWRTWAKSKNRLKTISPKFLRWLKDDDVTWLYGLIQTRDPMSSFSDLAPSASHNLRTDSFVKKKPSLKQRSRSEVILQRSISPSTLMKQAIETVQAQRTSKPTNVQMRLGPHTLSDSANASSPRNLTVSGTPSTLQSSSSPAGGEKRHVRFNNIVEQCIILDNKLDGHDYCAILEDDDDSSDDGIMMKPVHDKQRKLRARITPRPSLSSQRKTIAMLPPTTLEYREKHSNHQNGVPSGMLPRTRSTRLLPKSESIKTVDKLRS